MPDKYTIVNYGGREVRLTEREKTLLVNCRLMTDGMMPKLGKDVEAVSSLPVVIYLCGLGFIVECPTSIRITAEGENFCRAMECQEEERQQALERLGIWATTEPPKPPKSQEVSDRVACELNRRDGAKIVEKMKKNVGMFGVDYRCACGFAYRLSNGETAFPLYDWAWEHRGCYETPRVRASLDDAIKEAILGTRIDDNGIATGFISAETTKSLEPGEYDLDVVALLARGNAHIAAKRIGDSAQSETCTCPDLINGHLAGCAFEGGP